MTTTNPTSKRSAQRGPIASWRGALALLLALGAGCQARAVSSVEGSQTHFLRSCSVDCPAGLDCVCGVCTRPCELDLECGELASGATCSSADAACSGAAPSCTVECDVDADCRSIAGDMACVSGRCQGPALPATLRQGVGGPAAIGEPCVTGDESFATFSGFSPGEINIEGAGGACGPALACVANRFQGRVTCPAGQTEGELGSCLTPEGEPVSVPVRPQLESRPAERAVVCSCRCDGPDRDADYCSCPNGMQCEELIAGRGDRADDYTGSYCTYPMAAEPLTGPSERPGSP
jgi:hypothetical protein